MGLPIHVNNILSKGIKELQINCKCSDELACIIKYINNHIDEFNVDVDSLLYELDDNLVQIVNDKANNISLEKYADFCHNLKLS